MISDADSNVFRSISISVNVRRILQDMLSPAIMGDIASRIGFLVVGTVRICKESMFEQPDYFEAAFYGQHNETKL